MTATVATSYETGTLYHVDPGELLLERNVREAKPSADLIESVKSVGVLQPITAVLNDDGRLVVRYGSRRVMAALEAAVTPVPVYVSHRDDNSDEAEVDRIVSQRDENTHRDGLSAADEVGIVEQLAAFGLSASQISQQARIKKETVDTAIAVSGSKLAKKAAAKYADLTLDQAAGVAEFEDDPEVAKDLLLYALEQPSQFPHRLQRRRDDREQAQAKAEATAKLEAAGVTVVDRPDYDSKTKELYRLVDATTGKQATPANHKKCPGHVAWFSGYSVDPKYGCKDPAKNGHRDTYASGGGGSKGAAADMSDAEREAAKKARRLVIENNKAWDSAQTVRREWLAEFAKRKSPPKGAAAFISAALAYDRFVLTHDGNQTVREALAAEWGMALESTGYHKGVVVPAGTSEARALVIALVQVLISYESASDRMDWRRNGKTERHGRYLRFLESAGYGLSDVEKFALTSKTV